MLFGSKVLTYTGYVTVESLGIGDKVVGGDGELTTVTNIIDRHGEDFYRVIFSDDSFLECETYHLWQVNTGVRKFRGNLPFVLCLQDIQDQGLYYSGGKRKWEIPLISFVGFIERDLLIDPWLLGVLLGDGSIKQNSVDIASVDLEIVKRVAYIIDGYGLKLCPKKNNCNYRLTHSKGNHPNYLIERLRELGLWGTDSFTKFIPEVYLYNDYTSRLELLRGLMDTDGTTGKKNKNSRYYSISESLMEGVQFLVQSLGGTANKYKYRSSAGYTDIFGTSVVLPSGVNPFFLERKSSFYNIERKKYKPVRTIKDIEFVGQGNSRQITVSNTDGLFITNDNRSR